MLLETLSGRMQVTNPDGNSTATSLSNPTASVTSPDKRDPTTGVSATTNGITNGVILCGAGGASAPNGLLIIPFGAGSPTNTFILWAYGWKRTGATGSSGLPQAIWIPFVLASFTCTFGNRTGVANTPVDASQLFCGTIALASAFSGNANVSNEVVSPTGNTVGHILLDVKGSEFVEFRFDRNSSATSCNALVSPM